MRLNTNQESPIHGRPQSWAARGKTSTAWLIGGRILGSLCTLLILWQLARGLDLPDFGRLTFYWAIFSVLGCVIDFGTGQVVVQQSASGKYPLAELLKTGRAIRAFAAALCLVVWAAWCWTADEPDSAWLIAAGALGFTYILELTSAPRREAMRWQGPVIIRAGASLLALATVSVQLALGSSGVGPLFFGIIAAQSAGHVAMHLALRHSLPRQTEARAPLLPILGIALPLGLAALAQQLYFWIDNVFVRAELDESALGLYNLPVRLFSFAILVAVLAPQVALPWLAKEHKEGRLGPGLRRLGALSFGLGLFGAGVLFAAGEPVLQLFGNRYVESLPTLKVLLIALLAVHLGGLWTVTLIATGKTGWLFWIAITGLAINVAGNAWLLPLHGIVGAAIATAATEWWVVLASGYGLIRLGAMPASLGNLRTWASGAALAGLGWILGEAASPLLRWLGTFG